MYHLEEAKRMLGTSFSSNEEIRTIAQKTIAHALIDIAGTLRNIAERMPAPETNQHCEWDKDDRCIIPEHTGE